MVAVGAVYLAYRMFGPPGAPPAEPPATATAPRPSPSPPASAPGPPPAVSEPEPHRYLPEPALPAAEPPSAPAGDALVAVVIDDLGRSVADVGRLAALGVPLTYAVLPFESRTAEVVTELRRRRVETLLHLPMEAANGADPGPGALRLAMSDRELEAGTRAALSAVPGAVGVNNHMGSVLSADRRSMQAVLTVVGANRLFFLDSRTSPDTVAYRSAAELGIPAAERQVFLDPDPAPEAIRNQFHRLLGIARERGAAIAIGHPLPATLAVLGEEIPAARALGYRFVPVSYLLDRPEALPE